MGTFLIALQGAQECIKLGIAVVGPRVDIGGLGVGEVAFDLPADVGPATLLAQCAVLDPDAEVGIALSNALRIEWR